MRVRRVSYLHSRITCDNEARNRIHTYKPPLTNSVYTALHTCLLAITLPTQHNNTTITRVFKMILTQLLAYGIGSLLLIETLTFIDIYYGTNINL